MKPYHAAKDSRAATGATVRVHAGEWILNRTIEGATGEGNQNDLTLHLGLNTFSGEVHIDVTWPDGGKQATTGGVDRWVTIVKEQGQTGRSS